MMTSEQYIDQMDLSVFFDETQLAFDLREGILWNQAKTRVCLLSTDLILGVYKALVDEAGPAWSMILKNCGQVWGGRVVKRLDRECQLLLGQQLGEMPLKDFNHFLSQYFVFHGWGELSLDVAQATERGLVEATLRNSIFADVINDPDEMVDPMIAGMLASILSYLSGQTLDCVQTECKTRGAAHSRFIITAPSRLKNYEVMVKSNLSHDQIAASI